METVAVSAASQKGAECRASLSVVESDHQNKMRQVPTDPVAQVHHPDMPLLQIVFFNVVDFIHHHRL